MAEKAEQPTEGQTPEKPAKAKAKAKKVVKKEKKQKQNDELCLPVLVEFTFTSSVVFLILVFLVMATISWLTGTSLLDFVLRTSVAIGVLGSLLMMVFRQVSSGMLNSSSTAVQEKIQEPQPGEPEMPEPPEKP